jgi:hypothetical protein
MASKHKTHIFFTDLKGNQVQWYKSLVIGNVNVAVNGWQTYAERMLMIAAPFVFFTIVSVIYSILTHNISFAIMLFLINIAMCSIDITCIIVFVKYAPRNALFFGDRYKIARVSS